ncbi:MAG TPA: helix-turn-helix transcriptional regulator [Nanoarchaeota archaeon]|nr:helix-turn-helix transcriptional regulator [Nanoarchaeota archaeon]
MAKRLSAEIKEKITLLYDNGNGLDISKIAQQIGVSYQAIYSLTRIKQRTNPETGKLFESRNEYNDYLIRQRTNPETGKLFESRNEYKDYHIRQRTNPETGKLFASENEYNDYLIRQRTNPETGKLFASQNEYDDYHIRQRTNPKTRKLFASRTEYNDYHERQRTSRPENQELSDLIKKRLKELGRNQSWLAEEIEVTKQRVSQYVQGKSFPKEDVLQKLYSSLEVPYKTLEDFLDDRNTE